MKITVTHHNSVAGSIHSKLAAKLGREPTNAELKAEVTRILSEAKPKPSV